MTPAGVDRVGAARDQVVGGVERDEALGVARRDEDRRGVVDAHRGVERRVHDQQRQAQLLDPLGLAVGREVVEELLLDAERPAGQLDLGLARGLDLVARALEQVGDVAGVGRRADGGDGTQLRHSRGRRQHRGAAQAVADQQGRRGEAPAQGIGRGDQVVDVGTEVGVGELAVAVARPGEVEAQDGDVAVGELTGDAAGGEDVLAAGEAVGEQGEGARRRVGQVQPRRQLVAEGPGKRQFFAAHGPLPVAVAARNRTVPSRHAVSHLG